MSDETLVNLEDDGAEAAAAAITTDVASAEPATPAVEPPADEGPAEVEAVEVAGKKYVPVGALVGERKERQALQKEVDRVKQLEAEIGELLPYAKLLKANPQLLQQRPQEPPAAAKEPDPTEDPDAIEAARLMDFYTAEGKPDPARGAAWLKLQARQAQKISQQTVAPILEHSYQQRSNANFQAALSFKTPDGRSPSRESLQQIWGTQDVKATADPNVVAILALTAIGADAMFGRGKAPIPPPASAPLVTEASGGVPRTRVPMTHLEEQVASQRGISASKWGELTKGHNSGRPSVLED